MRLAVGIATSGRVGVLNAMLPLLRDQSRRPDAVVVCSPAATDIGCIEASDLDVKRLVGPLGLSRQRNEILKSLAGFDLVVFFDDDFFPHVSYLEATERVFLSCPDVTMTTGNVVADGVCGPGLTVASALAVLHAQPVGDEALELRDVSNGYGCNMAIRLSPVFAQALLFDEELPLYGWLEDVDFSCRLARHGRIAQVKAAKGIHLGVKTGRQSGVRLGYSQIANPVYLARKGTCSRRRALWLMSRNLLANLTRAFRPEPYIDRSGRVLGNARALIDLVRGELRPSRISSL